MALEGLSHLRVSVREAVASSPAFWFLLAWQELDVALI